jgi:hypothetical protein
MKSHLTLAALLAFTALAPSAHAQRGGVRPANSGTGTGTATGTCQSSGTSTTGASGTTTTAQTAARLQALQQRAVIAASLQANGVTATSLQVRQAALSTALQRVNMMLATDPGTSPTFTMQLLQRQATLTAALQQVAAMQSVMRQ